MQASRITIGETYAAGIAGKEVALTVTEIITVKSASKTENYVSGRVPGIEHGQSYFPVKKIPVADLIDEISKRQDLLDAQAKLKAEAEAREQARKDRQWLAVTLLAKAIGAQPVSSKYKPFRENTGWVEWDQKAAAVIVDSYAIELNEYAIDNIIATFGSFAENQIGA